MKKSRLTGLLRVLAAVVLSVSTSAFHPAMAQSKADPSAKIVGTVRGTVSAGEPMPGPLAGATVRNVTTGKGAVTDANGNYEIGITGPQDILQFRFLGFKDVDKIVGVAKVINLEMEDAYSNLDEIVVVGYGAVKKRDITGSIVSVGRSEIEEKMPTNVFDVLQGSAAGVQITSGSGQPGEGASVVIRGTSTMNDAGIGPLWVVDGVPCTDIDQINPYDIESMEVLKDAASAAIYGARSANGVIIVTTKKGDEKNPVLEVRYQHSFSSLTHKLPQINANQYREMQGQYLEYAENQGQGYVSQAVTNILYSQLDDPFNVLLNSDNDYQKLAYRMANKDQVDVSFGGGSAKLKYMLMGGYLGEQGIIDNTSFNRISLRINADYNATKLLTVGTRVNVSYAKKNGVDESGYLNTILSRKPTLSMYYPDGTIIGTLWGNSPLAAGLQTNFREYFRGSIFQYIDLNFSKNFKWTSNINANFGLVRYHFMRPTILSDHYLTNNGQQTSQLSYDWMNENYLNYKGTIDGAHNFEAMAGFSLQSWKSEYDYFKGKDSATDAIFTMNAFAANFDLTQTGSTATSHRMASAFARFSYNYKSRYIFSGNVRADGSSRFAKNKKVGVFPSASLAWRMSDESWMSWMKSLTINDAKVRVSYGVTGNEAIGDFDSQLTYNIGGIYDGVAGVAPSRIAVNDLGWEQTQQINAGLDLSFKRGRYQLTVDYFNKVTDNLLANYEIPKEWGFNTVRKNIGSISNQGVEASFKATFVDKKDWYFHMDANLTHNRNRVEKLAESTPYIYQNNWYISEGRPLGDFYGYTNMGVFAYDESNAFTPDWKQLTPVFSEGVFDHYTLGGNRYEGEVKQKTLPNGTPFRGGDINWGEMNPEYRDGIIDDKDRGILGNAQPFLTGGIALTLRFKQVTLSASSYFSFGGQIYNYARYLQDKNSMAAWSTTPTTNWVNNFWVRPGDNVEYPRPYSDSFQNDRAVSSKYIEDGSYFKIRNIRLTYRFKQTVLKKIHMRGLSIYGYVQNPFTFTAYSGYDPEFSSYSALQIGMDTNRFPRSREFGLGITTNF